MVLDPGRDDLALVDDWLLGPVDRAVEQGVGKDRGGFAQSLVIGGAEGGRTKPQLACGVAGQADRLRGIGDRTMLGEKVEEANPPLGGPAIGAVEFGRLGDDVGVGRFVAIG
ncbi:hypothetical protein GCM10022280_05940 [Sphingomonas swuensis]|uniref:Uncharacterized protein n=1 Tax=Sphingomonas swuensis TaxID=977800 RepID=A0ABP7SGC4_9SPHN